MTQTNETTQSATQSQSKFNKYTEVDRQKVRERISIPEVINRYIAALEEMGGNESLCNKMSQFANMRYKKRYLSPLHDGDGKNFQIYNNTPEGLEARDGLFHGNDYFKCWSRPDENGDVIKLYMMLYKCSFKKAMDSLFEMCGFKPESEKTAEDIEKEKKFLEAIERRNKIYQDTKEQYDAYYEKLKSVHEYLYDLMKKHKPQNPDIDILDTSVSPAYYAAKGIYPEVEKYSNSFPMDYTSLLPKIYRDDIRKHQESKFMEDETKDDAFADAYIKHGLLDKKFEDWMKQFKRRYEFKKYQQSCER